MLLRQEKKVANDSEVSYFFSAYRLGSAASLERQRKTGRLHPFDVLRSWFTATCDEYRYVEHFERQKLFPRERLTPFLKNAPHRSTAVGGSDPIYETRAQR
jgi:hypothetical protein